MIEIEYKKCTKCLELKPFNEFHKGRRECKVCNQKYKQENKEKIKLQKQEYYKLNKDRINNRIKIYTENNKEIVKNRKKKYELENKEIIKERRKKKREENKDYYNKKKRESYYRNKDKISARRKELRKTDRSKKWWKEYTKKLRKIPQYRILFALRCRVNDALQNNRKFGHSIDLLGCSIDFYKKYLESKFQSGMTWENYGRDGWHIDHIIPCASFDLTIEENQRKCFHYTNTQPMWALENISKGAKIL